MAVQQRRELLVVASFNQMNELMHDDVLKALRWFLHELSVESDMALGRIASTPLSLHALDIQLRYFYTK